MADDIYNYLKSNNLLKNEKEYKDNIKNRKDKIKKKKLFNKLMNNSNESDDDSETYRISVTEHKNLVIDNLIDNNVDQTHVIYLKNKFKKELEGYEFIHSQTISDLKIGHLVRYVNLENELKWGGILVKIFDIDKPTECILKLRNKDGKFWDIKFVNFYIFFKYRNSKTENFQKLFLSMINEN